MTPWQQKQTIASFLAATREIAGSAAVMESTLSAIKRALDEEAHRKPEPGLAELHVESARFAARAFVAERDAARLRELLRDARATIASREHQIRELVGLSAPKPEALDPAVELFAEPRAEDYLDRPFSETLDVSKRLRGLLDRLGRSTLRDVLSWTEADFLKHHGFGRLALDELHAAVASVGATLGQLAPDRVGR